MHYEILKEFVGKKVEVSTARRSFVGILKLDEKRYALIITPTSTYDSKYYGPVVMDQASVVSIRLCLEVDDDDSSENEDCDKAAV